MTEFKVGDLVYGHDWLVGEITQLLDDGVYIEYDSPRGGGIMFAAYDRLRRADVVVVDI